MKLTVCQVCSHLLLALSKLIVEYHLVAAFAACRINTEQPLQNGNIKMCSPQLAVAPQSCQLHLASELPRQQALL